MAPGNWTTPLPHSPTQLDADAHQQTIPRVGGRNEGGMIAGITIGIIIAASLAAAFMIWFLRRRHQRTVRAIDGGRFEKLPTTERGLELYLSSPPILSTNNRGISNPSADDDDEVQLLEEDYLDEMGAWEIRALSMLRTMSDEKPDFAPAVDARDPERTPAHRYAGEIPTVIVSEAEDVP